MTPDIRPRAKEDQGTGIWMLYWLACKHGKSYVGITTNLDKRFKMHQAGRGGRFTRAFRPTAILGVQPFPDRASASRAERWLKSQGVARKRIWAQQWPFVSCRGGETFNIEPDGGLPDPRQESPGRIRLHEECAEPTAPGRTLQPI